MHVPKIEGDLLSPIGSRIPSKNKYNTLHTRACGPTESARGLLASSSRCLRVSASVNTRPKQSKTKHRPRCASIWPQVYMRIANGNRSHSAKVASSNAWGMPSNWMVERSRIQKSLRTFCVDGSSQTLPKLGVESLPPPKAASRMPFE